MEERPTASGIARDPIEHSRIPPLTQDPTSLGGREETPEQIPSGTVGGSQGPLNRGRIRMVLPSQIGECSGRFLERQAFGGGRRKPGSSGLHRPASGRRWGQAVYPTPD